MAFTKVTNAGIGSTNTVLLHNLNVVGTVTATDGIFSGIGSFGGNVTIGGTLTYEDVTNVDAVGVITARNGISVLGAGVTIAGGGLNVTAGVSTFGGNIKVGTGITLSPDGDVYVTGVSTFSAVSGTTGTFSSDVSVTGDVTMTNTSSNPQLALISANNGISEIQFGDGADAVRGNIIYRAGSAGDALCFNGYNNTERMRIDSGGRILQGTTTYKSNLNSSADAGGQLAQFVGKTDDVNHCVSVFAYSGTTNPTVRGAKIQLNRARSTDGTTNTALADNDLIGTIEWKGNDGTSFTQASKIECFVDDSSVAADDMGGTLVFSTTSEGGHTSSERARIDSSGNTNFGAVKAVAFPSGTGIQVYHSSNPRIKLTNDTTGNAGTDGTQLYLSSANFIVDNKDSGDIIFHTNADEKARITSGGQFLMGGDTAYNVFENSSTAPRLQVRGTNLSGSCQAWIRATADAGGPKLFLANTRSTAEGGQTIVQSGDEAGQLHFTGSDGTQFVDACQIRGAIDGTPGADDMPGRLTFHTTPDGSTTCAERMRITSTGLILMGGITSATDDALWLEVYQPNQQDHHAIAINAGMISTHNMTGMQVNCHGFYSQSYSSNGIRFKNKDDTSHNRAARACKFTNNDGTTVGTIMFGTSSTAYNTSSDYRLKENKVAITDGITRLKTLKPYRFNFKSTPSVTVDGFYAHEVTSAVPEAITGEKDAVDYKGEIDPQTIDQAKLVPLLTAALQEEIAKREALEARVAALE
tara:strand:- start:11 stop:2269 length:2259 start_codon:yes stop_codon:yes gene_type:complete